MSRFPNESLHANPEKEKPPKLLKDPSDRPFQSKPPFCSVLQTLSVLEGLEKALALVQP